MSKSLSEALREERRARLDAAMAEEGFDVLAVVGNPWRSDGLRYATGVALTEGHAVALLERDGATRLLVEHPMEAERIAAEQPELKVSWSASAVPGARRLLEGGKGRAALAPRIALPFGLASTSAAAQSVAASAMLDRLMMRKSPAEVEAVRGAAAAVGGGA